MSAEINYSKSDQTSGVFKQILLEKLSQKNVEKATKLLEALDDEPNTVTFKLGRIKHIYLDARVI